MSLQKVYLWYSFQLLDSPSPHIKANITNPLQSRPPHALTHPVQFVCCCVFVVLVSSTRNISSFEISECKCDITLILGQNVEIGGWPTIFWRLLAGWLAGWQWHWSFRFSKKNLFQYWVIYSVVMGFWEPYVMIIFCLYIFWLQINFLWHWKDYTVIIFLGFVAMRHMDIEHMNNLEIETMTNYENILFLSFSYSCVLSFRCQFL